MFPFSMSQAGDYASLPSAQNARRHPRRKWLLLNTDSEDSVTCHPASRSQAPVCTLPSTTEGSLVLCSMALQRNRSLFKP